MRFDKECRNRMIQVLGAILFVAAVLLSGITVPSRMNQQRSEELGVLVYLPVFSPLLFSAIAAAALCMLNVVNEEIGALNWALCGLSGLAIWALSGTPFGFGDYGRGQRFSTLAQVLTTLSVLMTLNAFVRKKTSFSWKYFILLEAMLLLAQSGAFLLWWFVKNAALFPPAGDWLQTKGGKILAQALLLLGGMTIIPFLKVKQKNRGLGCVLTLIGASAYLAGVFVFYDYSNQDLTAALKNIHPLLFWAVKDGANLPLLGSVVVIGLRLATGRRTKLPS